MLYNKYFPSNYDELITYYPRYYRDVKEMVAILKSYGMLADHIEDNIERVFNNGFIETADEETIGRLEKFFGLEQNILYSLEQRRKLMKAFLLGNGKISATKIKDMVQVLTGTIPEVQFIAEHLIVKIPMYGDQTFNLSDIKDLLERRIPAHVAFYFALKLGCILITEDFKFRSFQRIPIYWFGPIKLDGCFLVNGERLLDAGYPPYSMRVTNRLKIESTESISHLIITVKNNLWHLDGNIKLDGSRIIDAYQYKEVIE